MVILCCLTHLPNKNSKCVALILPYNKTVYIDYISRLNIDGSEQEIEFCCYVWTFYIINNY